MKKTWNIKIDGRNMTEAEIIDAILDSRGIGDYDRFLTPTEEDWIPFEKMNGLQEACDIIMQTIDNGGKFIVHFDVDVDGCSAGTIMTRYLYCYTTNLETYINDGKVHGVEDFDLDLLDNNTTLIVVDSLNNNPDVYRRILSTGAKLIVIDHHIIEQELLDANLDFCLVSSANNYPNPALSGAGVVFKLCKYIDEHEWNEYADEYWDLAATGIIADMCDVSLQSPENRYICFMGLNNLKNPALSKINSGFGFDAKAISFGTAPLVNAANRMNENNKAMRLFMSNDQKEVNALVKDLKSCKERQNELVAESMDSLIEQGEAQLGQKCMYFFIDSDAEIAGLIGNKLLEKYKRPLFILRNTSRGVYAGSMRAVGIDDFAQIVNDTGIGSCMGHELAAGAIIPIDRFEEFKNIIEERLSNVQFVQHLDVDIQLSVEQITDDLIRRIKDINKISGGGFKPITVAINDVDDFEISNMSGGKHLKVVTPNVTFIKWNFSDWDMFDDDVDIFSGVGQLDCGFFGRTYYRQLILDDFKIEQLW